MHFCPLLHLSARHLDILTLFYYTACAYTNDNMYTYHIKSHHTIPYWCHAFTTLPYTILHCIAWLHGITFCYTTVVAISPVTVAVTTSTTINFTFTLPLILPPPLPLPACLSSSLKVPLPLRYPFYPFLTFNYIAYQSQPTIHTYIILHTNILYYTAPLNRVDEYVCKSHKYGYWPKFRQK